MSRLILVTGATGFVGGVIVRRLRAQGIPVRALVRDPSTAAARALSGIGVECLRGDLLEPEGFAPLCQGVDAIIHAASDPRLDDPERARRICVDGPAALFTAASRQGVRRFLLISTMAVYGGADTSPDEALEPQPFGDFYADLKIDAERAVADAADDSPADVVVLRFPAVYGPGSPRWTEEPLSRAREGRLVLPHGGEFAFPHLFIDNMADAVERALDGPSGTYDVFDGVVPFGEFMSYYAMIARRPARSVHFGVLRVLAAATRLKQLLTGRDSPLPQAVATRIPRLLPRRDHTAKKAQEQLGWTPRISLEEGMRRIAETAR